MAGSHVDEVLQACAVSRYLVRVVRLDRGEDAPLGHGDLYLQLSRTRVISFRAPGVGGMARPGTKTMVRRNAVLRVAIGVRVRRTFANSGVPTTA